MGRNKRDLSYLSGDNMEDNNMDNNIEETVSNLERFAEESKEEETQIDNNKEQEKAQEDKEEVKTEQKEIKVAGKFGKLLSKEDKKPKKTVTMIYLETETLDQIKTLSMMFKMNDNVENHSVTKLMEMACLEFIKGQEVDAELVAEYDRVNKKRGRKSSENQ